MNYPYHGVFPNPRCRKCDIGLITLPNVYELFRNLEFGQRCVCSTVVVPATGAWAMAALRCWSRWSTGRL